MTPCPHDDMAVREFDLGRCPETGYHDAGAWFICRDCGAEFTDREWEQFAAMAAER